MEKQWKTIELGVNVYAISNYGDVFNITKNKVQPFFKEGRGYYSFSTQKGKIKKNYKVHRLVAFLFIPNPENKPQVNHIDGNKLNNCVDNLEWVSASENNYHAIKSGLRTYKHSMKPIYKMKNGVIVKMYNSLADASKDMRLDKTTISKCALHKGTKTAGGFEWKYI